MLHKILHRRCLLFGGLLGREFGNIQRENCKIYIIFLFLKNVILVKKRGGELAAVLLVMLGKQGLMAVLMQSFCIRRQAS